VVLVLEHEDHEGREDHKGRLSLPPGLEAIDREVLDGAIKVHRALGPGLLEPAYEHCLAHELSGRGLSVRRQVVCRSNTKAFDLMRDIGSTWLLLTLSSSR
jgi:hypothetical protein